MKKFAIALFVCLAASAAAQTLTLNDAAVVVTAPQRGGINLASLNFYDSGQLFKNLLRVGNWNFEPTQLHQIFALTSTGTTTKFSNTNQYATIPLNFMIDSVFTVVDSQSNGAELGCTGTVASSTTGNGSTAAPVYTINPKTNQGTSGCKAPFTTGDIVVLTQNQFPTLEGCWEAGAQNCGLSASVTNSGKLLSDTTTPHGGKQSLILNVAAAANSTADARIYFNADTTNIFALMNGTYHLTGYVKKYSGAATPLLLSVTTPGGNCSGQVAAPTTAWEPFSVTCTFSETNKTTPNNHYADFYAQGAKGKGAIEIDDVGLQKVSSQDATNTTVFRDEVVDALKAFCATGTAGPGCPIRNWTNQNGETTANWTATAQNAGGTVAGSGFGDAGEITPQLGEYLSLVKLVGGLPYLVFPCTASTADATEFIDYMSSTNTSSGYGAIRKAQGQTAPWVGTGGVFSKVWVSFCNEAWNGSSFSGQALYYRAGVPNSEYYYDYSNRAKDIFAAMRKHAGFSTNMKLGFNLQLGVDYMLSTSLARMAKVGGAPDYAEVAPYTQPSVSSWQSDATLWGSALEEPWGNTADPASSSGFYQEAKSVQGLKQCGPAGTAACTVTVYEEANSTLSSCGVNGNPKCTGGANALIDQKHEDYITSGAGQGVIAPLQMLLNQQKLGITSQNYFGLTEFQNSTLPGMAAKTAKLWGCAVDMGGSTSYLNASPFTFRPQCLGMEIANQSIIGPEYTANFTAGLPVYNWPGSTVNGPTHALNSVPYIYAFCFKGQTTTTARSCVMINTSMTKAYTVTFAGTNKPTGTCTERQYAPSSMDQMNEAMTGVAINTTPAVVKNTTKSLTCPASISLPVHSVTALDFKIP